MPSVDSVISSAIIFFLIMDPLGNAPLFLTALRHTEPARRRKVCARELVIALIVMLVFLFGGRAFMHIFNLQQASLSVGGGVILMLIALRMIFPTPESNLTEKVYDEPFIVPLAVPYLAGPSLLAMEIVLVSGNPSAIPYYLLALVLAWTLSAIILFFSDCLHRILGEKALVAVERLMGMVLVILAIQMTLAGIAEFFGF